MTYLPSPDQQYYAHEYREFKKGYKTRRRMPSGCDPLHFIIALGRFLVALGRGLFNIARWIVRTIRRKR